MKVFECQRITSIMKPNDKPWKTFKHKKSKQMKSEQSDHSDSAEKERSRERE